VHPWLCGVLALLRLLPALLSATLLLFKLAQTGGRDEQCSSTLPETQAALQGAAALAPGASLASVNLRITISGGVAVPVPWTLIVQNPHYVGRVQQARACSRDGALA